MAKLKNHSQTNFAQHLTEFFFHLQAFFSPFFRHSIENVAIENIRLDFRFLDLGRVEPCFLPRHEGPVIFNGFKPVYDILQSKELFETLDFNVVFFDLGLKRGISGEFARLEGDEIELFPLSCDRVLQGLGYQNKSLAHEPGVERFLDGFHANAAGKNSQVNEGEIRLLSLAPEAFLILKTLL